MSALEPSNEFADVDLLGYVRVLMAHWRTLALVFFVTVTAAIAGSYLIRPVYRADVLLAGADAEGGDSPLGGLLGQYRGLASLAGVELGGGQGASVDETIEILLSRHFTQYFITERKLMPLLFEPQDRDQEPPTMWKAYKRFDHLRKISKDAETGFFKLSIEWHDPRVAAEWANVLVDMLNDYLRRHAIEEATRSIEYLQNELDKTLVVDRRQMLINLMEAETRKVVLARTRNEYAVRVLDRAVAPEEKVRPRRAIIAMAAAFFGIILGAIVVLGLEQRRRPHAVS